MCEKLLSSWHSSCVTMMIIILFIPLTILSSTASSSLCNITDIIIPQDSGDHFSMEHGNSCFVFALKPVTMKEAIKNCTRLGGHLTDIENDNNSTLQNYINRLKTNFTQIDNGYWIGLLHNYDLKVWYWVNGADLNQQQFPILNSFRKFPWYEGCIALSHAGIQNIGCRNNEKPYICRLDLGCSLLAINATRCSERCVAFIKSHMTNRTSDPNTTDDVYSNNNNNDNDHDKGTNFSINGEITPDHSREGHTCNSNDKLSTRQVDTQNVVIVAVLGGIVIILTVAFGAACAIIFKYRRLLRTMEQSPRISLVDILNADQSEARTKRPSQHSGSHHGSATELLYSSADGTSDPNKIDQRAVATSDIIYQNHNSLRGARDHSLISETNREKENNVYSHLNRSGENPDNEGSHEVYDMNSASYLKELQNEKSPTYEQY